MDKFYNKTIVFSGFKDQNLYNILINDYNICYENTISKNTELLIVEDIDKPYLSAKVKLAHKYKIPIIERWQLLNIINNNIKYL